MTRSMAQKGKYRLSLRIYLPSGLRLGPGKIALLEAVEEAGSIAGAARLLDMSYKRAWDLIEDLNASLKEPAISTMQGGNHGGGSKLTQSGKLLVEHYRKFEQESYGAGRSSLRAIGRLMSEEGQ